MILFKANFIFYIFFIAVHNVDGRCRSSFNNLLCVYDVYCQERYDLVIGLDELDYEVNRMIEDTDICKIVTAPEGHGYRRRQCYPIHLVYTESDISRYDGYIPRTDDASGTYSLAVVTSLDLSNNNYDFTPNLNENMINLGVINLSNNALSIANLYTEFLSLTEIHLSHNNIADIAPVSRNINSGLEKIDLSYNHLTKIPADTFDPFDKLQTLDLSHNYFDKLNQKTFEGLKQLLYLNISFNSISDINSSLFRFNAIKLLDLSNNKIKSITVDDFSELTSLETLDLNTNFLSVIEKDFFQNMPSLISLYLNNNMLENIDKDIFTNVNSLINIDMSENNFENLPKSLFKNKNLRTFSIKNNRLKGSIVKGIFEGLDFVTELDLSSQRINSIEDFGFYGLNKLTELFLNDNNIKNLSSKCFRTVQELQRLDLSNNIIESIEFEKDDLFNLLSLSLRNNHLRVIRHESFHGLNSLQYLDLSDNKITQVEINSFKSLKDLINFEISNNPLSGTLEESTFDGLNSLPSLDISCTLLSTIQNGSFIGMVQLTNLNISHSKINTLEYNIFVHTGDINTIDLSYNELEDFYINSTELSMLKTLYLNNNLLKTLDSSTLQGIPKLLTLNLSFNMIQNIKENTFKNQKHLHTLDISYNTNFKYTLSLLNQTKNVDILHLSGIKTGISFGNVKFVTLSQLIVSNSSVSDVKTLQINELRNLDTLSLSNNDIAKLEAGNLNNLSSLRVLDMSHNKITYIQPGVFKDNNLVNSLNISHNFLTVISYGVFRGLTELHTLDISFNNIKDLQNERFYEVRSLSILIADHNKIESVTIDEFLGTQLSQLSIGGNPIPCDMLVNLKRSVAFQITASRYDENDDENVFGVTCSKKSHALDIITNVGNSTADNTKVLINIRDILLDQYNNRQASTPTPRIDENYLLNITNEIQKSSSDVSLKMTNFMNSTVQLMAKNNETNILLNKILRVLTLSAATKAPPVQVSKDNATYENLLSYINRVKQELEETIKLDKSSILYDVDTKIAAINSHANLIKETPVPEMIKHEKLTASANSDKSMFTETCVALILIILVCLVLYMVYKTGVFRRRSLSISTRELPGAMDLAL